MNASGATPPETLFAAIKRLRVVVVGDLMVDEYVLGASDRISPEAPVQIIAEVSRHYSPGGAANTVCNMLALGRRSGSSVPSAMTPSERICAISSARWARTSRAF